MIRLTVGLMAWMIFHATGAVATNLINNPNFDTDISGWVGHAIDEERAWSGRMGQCPISS